MLAITHTHRHAVIGDEKAGRLGLDYVTSICSGLVVDLWNCCGFFVDLLISSTLGCCGFVVGTTIRQIHNKSRNGVCAIVSKICSQSHTRIHAVIGDEKIAIYGGISSASRSFDY